MGQENCLQLGGRFTSKLKQRHPPRPPLREKNFGSNVVTRNENSLAYQQDYSIIKVSYIVWLCMLANSNGQAVFFQKGADADWLGSGSGLGSAGMGQENCPYSWVGASHLE